jgi:hypothetical protein
MNKHLIIYGILIVVILILLNSVLTSGKSKPAGAAAGGAGGWKVYGTNGCGWTRKQLEVMKNKNIQHTFIDCDKEDCGDVQAFPTLVDSAGKKTVGFKDSF